MDRAVDNILRGDRAMAWKKSASLNELVVLTSDLPAYPRSIMKENQFLFL